MSFSVADYGSSGITVSVGVSVGGQRLGGGAGVNGQASRLSGTVSPSLSGIGVSVSMGMAVSVGIGIGVSVGSGVNVGCGVRVGAVVEVGKMKSVAVAGTGVGERIRVGGTKVKNCPGVFASVAVIPIGVILGNSTGVVVGTVRVMDRSVVTVGVGRLRGGADPQSNIPAQ